MPWPPQPVARSPANQVPERGVVDYDRIAEVGAVAGAKGLAFMPGDPVIGRVGEAGVATAGGAAVVVVDDAGVVGAAPFHALRLGHFGISYRFWNDDINIAAADKQG